MKKSLLALAVISAATMASAEVKLSGQVGVQLTSDNGARATVETKSTRLNVYADQEIGSATVYANVRLNLDNKKASISSSKGYVGIKGGFGDFRFGDAGTGCGYTEVGGVGVTSAQVLDGKADASDCSPIDGTAKNQGVRYTNDFGSFKVGASYRPGDFLATDQYSIGLGGEFGPVKASLGYTGHASVDAETIQLGVEGAFGDFKVGAQYSNTDLGAGDSDAWELGVNYALASGDIYAGYGNVDAGGSDVDGWMLGYKHNISDRTWTWLEIGEKEGESDTSWSTGLMHKF